MKILKQAMIWVILTITFFVVLVNIIGFVISAPGYDGPENDHFNGKTFQNISKEKAKEFKDVLKWYLNRDQGEWHKLEDFEYAEKPVPGIEGNKVKVTLVNHSTFLIQTNGVNILTDPIWSERTSPVSFMGPERQVPPGIRFEDLPDIDVVIISHNHYDHLDVPTIKRLQEKFKPHFYVPLGLSVFLRNKGVEKSTDMDWWDEREISAGLQLACVPAQHFSGRGTYDRDKTLWAGFVIKVQEGNIYFAGDTGYGDFFKDISEKYSPFRVALLPIGAYKPSWFMSPIHLSPEEAVKAHLDIGAQKSLAMHYGTFPLADDGMEEPVKDLMKAIEKYGLSENEFVALNNGGSIIIE